MIYTRVQLVLIAEAEALKQELDPALVCAIIDTLSEWHPERCVQITDGFGKDNHSLVYGTTDEANLQGTCIGLMQFSGRQARQLEYKQDLEGLLHPPTNCEIGVKIVKASLEASSKRLERALVISYGYGISALIPKIISKLKPYEEFLASPERPSQT